MVRSTTAIDLLCLCALIAAHGLPALAQPAPAPVPSTFQQSEWSLAGLGNTTGPVGKPAYITQRANLLVAAGEAAQGVVNGSVTRNSSLPNSFAVTSPSNAAQQGQVDSRGLLVYQPATTVIDALDFQTFFGASYSNSSVKGIVLAPGTYSINNTLPSFHISLYCNNRQADLPFELDFSNSSIFFGNYQNGGIGFFFCQNFYFHGPFNFMYAVTALPFSQGSITGLISNGDGSAQYTVRTDEGYPTTTTGLGDGKNHLNIAYDSAGRIVLNSSDIYSEVATQNADGTYTFTANLPPNVAVGTRLAIRGNAGNHGIFTYKCVNFRVSFVYMYTSPIFGFLDTFGTNVTISNNVIQPWPFPIGTTRPLLSTNADGIHSVGGRGSSGPKIISNQIINPGDDAIAIHGNYYTVYAYDSLTSSLIIFSPNCGVDFCSLFQAGDTVAVYSSPYVNNGGSLASSETAYTNLGTATISTVTQLNTDPNFHPGFPYFGDTGASIYPLVNYNVGFYYRVTFTTLPSGYSQATKDGLIADLSANGDNFNVASNFITNHRARSIHIKSNNGVVTNNIVQNPNIYGLLFSPDLYFLEGDFISNVIVSNNYVNATFGNLFHVTLNPVDFTVVSTQNSKNLSFTSNVFDNAGTWSVAVSSVNGLTFQGNIVRNAGCYPSVFGNFLPFIPARTLVYLAQIANAFLRGNFFTTTLNCQAQYGNYASPYYADNVGFGTG